MSTGDPRDDAYQWDDALGWVMKRPLVEYIGPTQALDGFVMAPNPEWERRAAQIICGHPFIHKDWPETKMLEFEMFVREVLQTTAPQRS